LDDLELQEDAHAPKVDQALLDWRQSWFLIVSIGTALNLLSILFVVMTFNRDLMQRILVLNKNFTLFVEGKILEPELVGTDEIAQLDRAFRKVAGSLADAQSKEAALFHSVKSVLASVDQHGRIQEVNDAATRILGYEPHELIGSHIYDVVPGEQRKRTMDMFKAIRTSVPKPFELTVARKDDSLINTLWSLSYTPAEQKIFCVIQDISERSEAEKMRKQVLQMVSHDLRNPLSTVDVVYAILGKGNLVDFNASGRDSLAMAKAKLATMLGLVNNLLDIEKIEAGMLDLEIASLPTGSVFEAAINQLRDEIRTKNVHIYMIGAGLFVSGDQYRLEQVMTNLLAHAVKRSPLGGNVRIAAAEERGGRVRLSVSDEGPMLSGKQMARLFSRFREQENAESTSGDDEANGAGADLSMAICKMLVELHGGQIDVKSTENESIIFFSVSVGRQSH
jgi:PAS domain S-box-containing protein